MSTSYGVSGASSWCTNFPFTKMSAKYLVDSNMRTMRLPAGLDFRVNFLRHVDSPLHLSHCLTIHDPCWLASILGAAYADMSAKYSSTSAGTDTSFVTPFCSHVQPLPDKSTTEPAMTGSAASAASAAMSILSMMNAPFVCCLNYTI